MKPAWHPTPHQELLLEACLAAGDRAAAALRSWTSAVDLQRIDGGSHRLLPLLAVRKLGDGMDPGMRALIKGVYRKTWYQNQLLLAEARLVAASLAACGVPVMLLKGAPLALEHYRDVGVRPMADLDLVVPVGCARRAAELMIEQGYRPDATPLTATMTPGLVRDSGWSPGIRPLDSFDERYFSVRHAHGFRKTNGLGIDLHWHVFQGDCDPDSDAGTWQDARRVTYGGFSFLIPAPHEHLLLVLAHAARWSPAPSIRWVTDAVTLLRTSPGLDWEGLIAVAVRRRHTCSAGELLSYLATRFGVDVPGGVLRTLADHPITRRTRAAHRRAVSRPTPLTGLAEICYLHDRYRALRRRSPETCPAGFLRFMCGILGADHIGQVVDYSWREGVRRLRGIR